MTRSRPAERRHGVHQHPTFRLLRHHRMARCGNAGWRVVESCAGRQHRPTAGWWPPICSPRSTATGWCPIPSATASATTSTEGPDRSSGFPLTGKATPMHSPALADLVGRLPAALRTSSEAAHSPRPRVVVCGPYATRGAREGATGAGPPITNSAAADEAAA